MSVARDQPAERLVGLVARYDAGRRAMEVALSAALRRGDRIRVRDAASDRLLLEQVVAQLTVEGRDVPSARRNNTVRIDVAQAVKPRDRVLKLSGRPSAPPPGPPGPEPSWPEPDQPTPPPEPAPTAPTSPDSPTPDDEPDLPDLDDVVDDDQDDTRDDRGDDRDDATGDDGRDAPDDDTPDDSGGDGDGGTGGDAGDTTSPRWPTRPRPKGGGPGG